MIDNYKVIIGHNSCNCVLSKGCIVCKSEEHVYISVGSYLFRL